MLIYFSATGNNQYVAKHLSQQLNEKSVSMIQLTNNENYEITLQDNEYLGIIIPTYFLGLPKYVEEFLSKINIQTGKNNFVFVISSYGSSPGYSTGYIKEYLEEQKIHVNAEYSIKMPDTWTPLFDASDKTKIHKTNEEVEIQLKKLINNISNKTEGNFTKRKLPKIIANFAQMMYDDKRKTSNFIVEDQCNACGLCVDSCPINAIAIKDNQIEWVVDRCVLCLRCLHRCPTFAIHYKNRTQNRGQYTNPNITKFD